MDAGLRGRPSPFSERSFFVPLRRELSSLSLAPFFYVGAISSPVGVEFAEVGAISTPPVGYFPELAIVTAIA